MADDESYADGYGSSHLIFTIHRLPPPAQQAALGILLRDRFGFGSNVHIIWEPQVDLAQCIDHAHQLLVDQTIDRVTYFYCITAEDCYLVYDLSTNTWKWMPPLPIGAGV